MLSRALWVVLFAAPLAGNALAESLGHPLPRSLCRRLRWRGSPPPPLSSSCVLQSFVIEGAARDKCRGPSLQRCSGVFVFLAALHCGVAAPKNICQCTCRPTLENCFFYVSCPRHSRRCVLADLLAGGSLSEHVFHALGTFLPRPTLLANLSPKPTFEPIPNLSRNVLASP